MTEKQLIVWLIEEMNRADKDYEMSTGQDDADYHLGELEAYREVLATIRGAK